MGTITARSIKRQPLSRGRFFPRDHFKMLGVDPAKCHGSSVGARVLDVFFRNRPAVSFRHPTKARTAGRICFYVAGGI